MKTLKHFKILFIFCTVTLVACDNHIHWQTYNKCINYTTDKSTFSDILQKTGKRQVTLVGTLDSLGNIIPLEDSLSYDSIASPYDEILFQTWGIDTLIKSDNFKKPMLICINTLCAARQHTSPTIYVSLKDSTSKKSADMLIEKVKLIPFVSNIKYVSKDSSAKQIENELGEDFVNFLGYNPIPDILEIQLLNTITEKDIDNFQTIIMKDTNVKEADIKGLRQSVTDKSNNQRLVLLIKK